LSESESGKSFLGVHLEDYFDKRDQRSRIRSGLRIKQTILNMGEKGFDPARERGGNA